MIDSRIGACSSFCAVFNRKAIFFLIRWSWNEASKLFKNPFNKNKTLFFQFKFSENNFGCNFIFHPFPELLPVSLNCFCNEIFNISIVGKSTNFWKINFWKMISNYDTTWTSKQLVANKRPIWEIRMLNRISLLKGFWSGSRLSLYLLLFLPGTDLSINYARNLQSTLNLYFLIFRSRSRLQGLKILI